MPPDAAVVMIFCVFGWIPLKVVLNHRLKMAEIKARGIQNHDAGTLAAIEQIRDEVRQLRDTAMRYDMSFDAALTRMEERVDRIETRSYTTTEDPLIRLRTEQ